MEERAGERRRLFLLSSTTTMLKSSSTGLRARPSGIRIAACIAALALALAQPPLIAAAGSIGFRKIVLTQQYLCDGIHASDFNRDGKMDVVAGPYWYAG